MQFLKFLSLAATVSTCLPSIVQQIRNPNNQSFLYALLNSAFSFYLFSFQGMKTLSPRPNLSAPVPNFSAPQIKSRTWKIDVPNLMLV